MTYADVHFILLVWVHGERFSWLRYQSSWDSSNLIDIRVIESGTRGSSLFCGGRGEGGGWYMSMYPGRKAEKMSRDGNL